MDNLSRSDQIKEDILIFLNEVMSKARNENMAKVTDAQIQRRLRDKGYAAQEVTKELLYLVSAGRVKRVTESYTYDGYDWATRKAKKMRGKQVEYMISDKGRDYIEGKSKFGRRDFVGGVNINNIQGAVAIGENNTVIVNQQHYDVYQTISELEEAIKVNDNILDRDKAEYLGDVTTLKGQVAKKSPNKVIVKLAWGALATLANIEGVMQFIQRLQPLVQNLIK